MSLVSFNPGFQAHVQGKEDWERNEKKQYLI
jgi:hypothetical protein